MSRPEDPSRNQRGFALAVVILALLVLSVVAIVMLRSIAVDTTTGGSQATQSKALSYADAGVNEAIERLRSGEVPDTLNPRMVTQIFNAAPGAVPALGADSTALATAQPTDKWLNYSSGVKGPDVLTVTYKTNAARTSIYKYDTTKNPAVQTATGTPIFVITSTGRLGSNVRTVVAEVTKVASAGTASGKAAANGWANSSTSILAHLCGYNHSVDTPTWTGCVNGRDGSPGSCNEDPANGKWEIGSTVVAGAWSGAGVGVKDPTCQYGNPPVLEFQTPNYAGPWEVLGLTQAQFAAMVTRQSSIPANLNGIIYVDNDATMHNSSGKYFLFGPISGTGLLYIDGDLDISGDFDYRGLLYVEGYCKTSDKLWVLGMAYSGQKFEINSKNYGCAILYSSDAIMQGAGLSNNGAKFVMLSWREI